MTNLFYSPEDVERELLRAADGQDRSERPSEVQREAVSDRPVRGVVWSDAEREAVTGALTVEPVGDVVMVVNRDGTQAMGASLTIDAPGFAQVVLAALAPFVAAREAQAVQDYLEKRDLPVMRIETAGEAALLVDPLTTVAEQAEAERDQLAETLRLRSEALSRVTAERDRVRREVEKCRRLTQSGLLTNDEAFHVIGNVVLGYTTAALAGKSDE